MFDEASLQLINEDEELKAQLKAKGASAIELLDTAVLAEAIQNEFIHGLQYDFENISFSEVIMESVNPHLERLFKKLGD